MEITAKIQTILSKSTLQSKGKDYLTQTFTVEAGSAQYPKILAITIFNNDNAMKVLDTLRAGDTATFSLDVSSKEYQGKYFHNINCYKIANVVKAADNNYDFGSANPSDNFYPVEAEQKPSSVKPAEPTNLFQEVGDDLPW
jgi:hypothetical protein